MKKLIAAAILLLAISPDISGQIYHTAQPRRVENKEIVDTSVVQVLYRVTTYTTAEKKMSYVDNQALEVGEKHVRYYSQLAESVDSVAYNVRQGVIPTDGTYSAKMFLGKDQDCNYEEIFSAYPSSGAITVYNRFFQRTFVYEEPTPTFDWSITSRKETILEYDCFEATCSFRGREYSVWFTTEIPLSYGPWKFSGLPGLILKAEDSEGLFSYEATSITSRKEPIYHYDDKAKECKRKDILKLNNLRYRDMHMLISSTSDKKVIFVVENEAGETKTVDSSDMPMSADAFIQMELE